MPSLSPAARAVISCQAQKSLCNRRQGDDVGLDSVVFYVTGDWLCSLAHCLFLAEVKRIVLSLRIIANVLFIHV